jgi:hypothetical protein
VEDEVEDEVEDDNREEVEDDGEMVTAGLGRDW